MSAQDNSGIIRAEQFRRITEYMREIQRRKAIGLPPPNRLDQYEGKPLDFITEGLGQCREVTWWPWRVVLKAAFGFSLNDQELSFFREVAGGRDPPGRRVKELWLVIGRRGGKDSIASLIAVNAARYVDTSHLRPGETALVACLANDLTQAGIVFGYTRGYFEKIPELGPWLKNKLPESSKAAIELVNRTEIRVTTNNFRATRGYPIACAIFDEVATWRYLSQGMRPDLETYRAILPAMMPDAMLVGISSAYRKKGLLYEKWEKNFGVDDPDILVIQATTRQFNSTRSEEEIQRALRDDPQAAAAEWLSRWREDLADYVDRNTVEAAIQDGIFERPRMPGIFYKAFVDPSGGSVDSFTLAIAHGQQGRGILDCVQEIHAPFQPSIAVAELSETMKRYGINECIGDRYAALWPVEQFRRYNIRYEQSATRKSDLYRDFLPILNSGRADLLDWPARSLGGYAEDSIHVNSRLVEQLCGLERRTVHGGRDSIDHPNLPGMHDDVANATAGVLVMVAGGPDVLDQWRKAYG